MSGPRRDGPFEVPVSGLAGGRGQARRAAIVAVSIVAVVGGAFGLARWAPDDGATAHGSAAPGASGRAISAVSPPPSAEPRRSTGPRPRPRIERVLDIPDRALTGGPALRFVEIAGRDLRFVDWHPGSGLTDSGSMTGILGPDEPIAFPILAPTGLAMLFVTPVGTAGPAADEARIVNGLGRTLWTDTDIASASGGLWSADGTLAVLAGNGRRWHLVSITGFGTSRGAAVDTVVDLPGEVFLPPPIPIGSIAIPRIPPRTAPVGFSADGRWIYGAVISPELGIVIDEFRVRIDGGQVERVADFGVGREDGLVPRPGTVGGRLVDPASGRVSNYRVNPDTTGGPPTLEVREADAAFAFEVDVATPLGSAWGGDGSLYVLSADSPLFPDRVILARVEPDGSLGRPLLETGPITAASLLDLRDGFAAIVVWTSRPTVALQLVLVDLVDPSRVTALSLPDDLGPIVGGELRR